VRRPWNGLNIVPKSINGKADNQRVGRPWADSILCTSEVQEGIILHSDYYLEKVIDFYRYLPSRGYKIIVFRVHSAIPLKELVRRSYPIKGEPVFLFTNEPYDSLPKYWFYLIESCFHFLQGLESFENVGYEA